VDPTTATGLNTMTPAQQQREIAREAARWPPPRKPRARAEGPGKGGARCSAAQQRSIDTAIRTGGKVVTSRLGQDIVRGIFGTLFGGGKSR